MKFEELGPVRRYDRGGGRGLYDYGRPFPTRYGHMIEVSDSSSAETPCLWMRVSTSARVNDDEEDGTRSVHMDRKEVLELMRRLATWIGRVEL